MGIKNLPEIASNERWVQRTIPIRAGVVENIITESRCNVVLIRNLGTLNSVFVSLDRNLSLTSFESIAEPLSYGTVTHLTQIDILYVFSEVDTNIIVVEIYADEPSNFIHPTIARQFNISTVPTLNTQPVTGEKTVGVTATELFAGGSRLAGRHQMTVMNMSSNTVWWGNASVTVANGFPLTANSAISFNFNPNNAIPIFFIAGAGSLVRVVELA